MNKQITNSIFEYKEEYKHPRSAMLNITDNCNLACRYCFVEQHPHNMSLQTAKDALQYLYNNVQYLKENNLFQDDDTKENIKYNINFFGGEPLLLYKEIIKPLVEYTEKTFPNVFKFGVTTNVTLLDKEKVDFFKEHNFGILTSIDGAEETQCYNRPCRNGDNSFKLIEKNIPYLLEQFPAVCFRSTGYAPTIHHLFNNYLYAESLGFRNYTIIMNERDEWTSEQKEILKNELRKIQFYRLQQLIKGIPPMNSELFNFNEHIFPNLFADECNIVKNDNILRCGLGTLSCAIGWDGKIYGCQQDVSLNNKNIFYIGDIYNGIDPEKHANLLSKYIQEIDNPIPEKCLECRLKDTCYGNASNCCPSTNNSLFNNTHQISDIRCFVHQELFKTGLLSNSIFNLFNTPIINGEMIDKDIEKKEEN